MAKTTEEIGAMLSVASRNLKNEEVRTAFANVNRAVALPTARPDRDNLRQEAAVELESVLKAHNLSLK